MTQALLHREQDIGVAAGLDIDDPIWMKTGEMKGRGKQVAPAQAPEDGAFHSSQDSCQKDRCARLVREIGTAHHLMESACSNASARQSLIQFVDAERNRFALNAYALDTRDARSQIFKDC